MKPFAALLVAIITVATAFTATRAADTAKPIRVVVWDEEQPAQKKAYDNFLGNAVADFLKSKDGLTVKSVKLDDPDQGLSDETLDNCDVLIWWGHVRHADVKDELATNIVERIKAGKLSLISLHSAHYSKPFMFAMYDRAIEDAKSTVPEGDRDTIKVETEKPKPGLTPPDMPLTPSSNIETGDDGKKVLKVILPACVFPAVRADGKPSHVTVLDAAHPIMKGVPATFDIPQTEMYADPFHIPKPDATLIEEKWDAGETFHSGCVWNVGKGKVFYFRPGHETYPILNQGEVQTIVENAVRWLGSEMMK